MPLSTRARLLATLPFVPALMLSAHTQIPTFRADTRLVLIRFAVSPKVGAFATDLRPEDIQILEDGIPQKPVVFSGARFLPRTLPLEITLLFDISGSVRSTGSFSSRVFRPELLDEFENASIAVYAFSDRLIRFTRPTRDRATLLRAMDDVMGPPPRDTPLFNSILETMRDAASSKPNAIRVLMVFSDGEANMLDRIYDKAVVRVAHELGFSIFPVVLPMSATARPKSAAAPVVIRNGRPPIIMLSGASSSAPDFVKLAEATGGQSYNVPWTDEILHSLLKRIAAHFQYDYVAGFYPVVSGEAKRHKAEVTLRNPKRGKIIGGMRIVVH